MTCKPEDKNLVTTPVMHDNKNDIDSDTVSQTFSLQTPQKFQPTVNAFLDKIDNDIKEQESTDIGKD